MKDTIYTHSILGRDFSLSHFQMYFSENEVMKILLQVYMYRIQCYFIDNY